MFRKKNNVLMVVHNVALFWLSTDPADRGRCLWRLPLETVMEGRQKRQLPNRVHSMSQAFSVSICAMLNTT